MLQRKPKWNIIDDGGGNLLMSILQELLSFFFLIFILFSFSLSNRSTFYHIETQQKRAPDHFRGRCAGERGHL